MNARREDAAQALKTARMVALLYSVVFCSGIFFGYFLLVGANIFAAVAVGILMATLAWWLAKLIGSSEGGVPANLPSFALLLIISAVGIMNALFLNLEGRVVFAEAIQGSQDAFSKLRTGAGDRLTAIGAIEKRDKTQRLTDALIKEIDNPLNCGQGPEAKEIMGNLRSLLPDFLPLSGQVNCKRNAEVVESYRDRIALLTARAPWNNPELWDIASKASAQKTKLQVLESKVAGSSAYGLMNEIKPALKDVDVVYQDSLERLEAQGGQIKGLPAILPLQEAQSLGEWSQLLGLIIDRLGKPSTYVYIFLAIGFDWIMIHLFARVRKAKLGVPGSLTPRPPSMERAW